MFWNDDDYRIFAKANWGRIGLGVLLVLGFAVVVLVLVSTADFGNRSPTTVPRTPGACAPFCNATPAPGAP